MEDKPQEKIYFLNDLPIQEDDLGFGALSDGIAKFINQWIAIPFMGPIIGIYGSFGSGKTTLMKLVEKKLTSCQPIWFRPTFYENESEVAAAFFESALKQIQVEVTGFKRIKIKTFIRWHNTSLPGGVMDLLKQLFAILVRIILYVGGPVIIVNLLMSSALTTIGTAIVTVLGSTAIAAEYIQKALEPGLNLNAEKFVKRVKVKSVTNALEEYVKEFQWVARLARSSGSPLVVIVDAIDDGLPIQTAIIIETLRLFGTGQVPCVFVITANKESLYTAVHLRFLNQIGDVQNEELQEKLAQMAKAYLERIVQVPFEIPPLPKAG